MANVANSTKGDSVINRMKFVLLALIVPFTVSAKIEKPIALSSGFRHTCALEAEGNVICWGDNSRGQTKVPANITNPTKIYSGGFLNCAKDDSGYNCWGGNNPDLKKIPLFTDFKALALGTNHNCRIDGTELKCWGNEMYTQVPALKNPSKLSVGGWVSCALDEEGVKCWGYDPNKIDLLVVPKMKNPTHIVVGNVAICAVDEGKVICWGFEAKVLNANIPQFKNPDFATLCVGAMHACLQDEEGVKCWLNSKDFTGITKVPPLSNPRSLSCGGMHACAIDDTGVKCWGENDKKQTEVPQ